MHHVIQLHFDATTEEKLRKARDALYDAKLDLSESPSIARPHITLATTLATGQPLDIEQAAKELKEAFEKFPAQSVELSHLDQFTVDDQHHILYVGLTPGQDLCRLQEKVYQIVERHSASSATPLTRPGTMVFHSTLALKVPRENLSKARELLKFLVPMTARFISAGIIEAPSAVEKIGFSLAETKLQPHSSATNKCPSPKK